MEQKQLQTVNIDGKAYQLDDLSPNVRQAIGIYNTFNTQLQEEQLAVIKTQAALQHLGSQISETVRKEQEAAASKSEEDTPAQPVDRT